MQPHRPIPTQQMHAVQHALPLAIQQWRQLRHALLPLQWVQRAARAAALLSSDPAAPC